MLSSVCSVIYTVVEYLVILFNKVSCVMFYKCCAVVWLCWYSAVLVQCCDGVVLCFCTSVVGAWLCLYRTGLWLCSTVLLQCYAVLISSELIQCCVCAVLSPAAQFFIRTVLCF